MYIALHELLLASDVGSIYIYDLFMICMLQQHQTNNNMFSI